MKQLVLIIVLLASLKSYSQSSFHRNYPLAIDSTSINLGGLYLKDGNFLMVGGIQSKKGDIADLLFAKLDNKGDHVWSYTFNPDTLDGVKFDYTNVGLVQSSKDTIYFMANLSRLDGAKKVFGSLSKDGVFGWSKFINLDTINNDDLVAAVEMVSPNDSVIVQASTFGAESVPIIGAYNVKQQRYIAEKFLTAEQNDFSIADIAIDTTLKVYAIVGDMDDQSGYYLSTLSPTLEVNFARKFKSSPTSTFSPKAVTILNDSSMVVVGRYFELDVLNIPNSFFGSFVAKHSKTGVLEWAKYVNLNDSFPVNIGGITEQGESLVMAGSYVNKTDLKSIPLMASINKDGTQFWAQEYKRSEGLADYVGKAVSTKASGGYIFFTNVLVDGQDTVASMIRIDALGSSSCQTAIERPIFFNLTLTADTMALVASSVTRLVQQNSPKSNPLFDNFDIPTLTLETKNFCPNEPILWVYRAQTEGAIAYKWSTGSTADSITVMDDEEYSVIVTIDTNVCFTLCDTAKVGKFQEPMVALTLNQGQFCTTGLMTAGLQYTPGAAIQSITWSNGQTNLPFVQVNAGALSVTVVDECMESASADTVVVLPKLVSAVTITPDFGSFCTAGSGRLNATADAPVTGYVWSNGSTASSTGISTPGSYTVMVRDICNNPVSQSITVNQTSFPKIVTDLEVTQSAEEFCKTGNITLGVLISGQFNSIKWSSGGTQETEQVPGQAGNYSVAVTDDCRTTTAEVTVEDIESVCFKIPKIFFPDSNEAQDLDENNKIFKVFGGNCGDLNGITNFELHIFNRWGQEVFSSDSPTAGWDGMFSDKPAPPDSYVYYLKYTQADCDLEKKGDLTLIR